MAKNGDHVPPLSCKESYPTVLLVQQQGENEKKLTEVLVQIEQGEHVIDDLRRRRANLERCLAHQPHSDSLAESLYTIAQDLVRKKNTQKELRRQAKILSETMKVVAHKIQALLKGQPVQN